MQTLRMQAVILACLAASCMGFSPSPNMLRTMTHAGARGSKITALSTKPGLLRPAVALGLSLNPRLRANNGCMLTSLQCNKEGRAFAIGDAVEAQWIGDDGWYAGSVEGYLTENRYDIRWADAQGLADTQVTEADNVRPFDPVIYYRYGRGALEQGDIVTAYLSFRTVFFCMGPYYDSYDRMKELESDSAVQELLTKRKDLEILSLSNRQDRFSDKMKEMKEMEEEDAPSRSGQEDDGLYSPEEVEGLREKAQEDQDLRAMWAQARAFQDNQEGTWHGMYEDFGYTGDSFEPKGAGTYETSWESNREDSDQPKFVRRTRSDEASEGIVIRDFYPASTASWFVQNVFTLADFKEEKGRLKLQVGIRNGPYRMRATFKYVRGEEVDEFGKATWELAAVRIGREKLDESPTAEDLALFRVPKKSDKKGAKKSKEDAATSAPLTGAADRVSTEELQTSYEIATLACAGSVTVEGPKTIPEAQLTGLNRQILLKWNVPSVPGIAWDGKDRMLPAMMCSAGRIFKWPGEELEMLSMYTSESEDP